MTRTARILQLLFPVVLALPATASANELDCLLSLKGATLRWDSSWQADRTDQGISYRVQSVIDQTPPGRSREVTLILVTEAAATRRARKVMVNRPVPAIRICQQASGFQSVRRESSEQSVRKALNERSIATRNIETRKGASTSLASFEKPALPAQLSFRTLIAGTWLPVRPVPGEQQFVCSVKNTAYACSERDYQFVERVNTQNGLTPRTIAAAELPHPLIRFTAAGWRLAAPIDLNPKSQIVDCVVGSKKFSCLKEERIAHSDQLRTLAAEAAVAESWE